MDGWMVSYTPAESLSWVYRHLALPWMGGGHEVDFCTFRGPFFSFCFALFETSISNSKNDFGSLSRVTQLP